MLIGLINTFIAHDMRYGYTEYNIIPIGVCEAGKHSLIRRPRDFSCWIWKTA